MTWAQSLNYHLERIALQSQSLQQTLLNQAEPTWGQKTAADDLRRLRASSEAFQQAIDRGNLGFDEATQFLVQLEVAAARVRTSRELGGFDAAQLVTADEIQVETREVRRALERQKNEAQRQRRRQSPRIGIGVGFGSPWGYPGWGRWGYGPFYRGWCR